MRVHVCSQIANITEKPKSVESNNPKNSEKKLKFGRTKKCKKENKKFEQ